MLLMIGKTGNTFSKDRKYILESICSDGTFEVTKDELVKMLQDGYKILNMKMKGDKIKTGIDLKFKLKLRCFYVISEYKDSYICYSRLHSTKMIVPKEKLKKSSILNIDIRNRLICEIEKPSEEVTDNIDKQYERFKLKTTMLGYSKKFEYVIVDNNVIITSYKGTDEDLTLPKFFNGIWRNAFSNRIRLKMNDELKYIGEDLSGYIDTYNGKREYIDISIDKDYKSKYGRMIK